MKILFITYDGEWSIYDKSIDYCRQMQGKGLFSQFFWTLSE